jgi:hypothetical protein
VFGWEKMLLRIRGFRCHRPIFGVSGALSRDSGFQVHFGVLGAVEPDSGFQVQKDGVSGADESGFQVQRFGVSGATGQDSAKQGRGLSRFVHSVTPLNTDSNLTNTRPGSDRRASAITEEPGR